MKTTVCEFPNDPDEIAGTWKALCAHVSKQNSELVLLPEMPFSRWLAGTQDENDQQWNEAVQTHLDWIDRLHEVGSPVVLSTRPVVHNGFVKMLALYGM